MWGFVALGVLVVVAFVWASVRNSRNYEEFFQPPDDLKRADQRIDPTGGAPNGGSIWPDGR